MTGLYTGGKGVGYKIVAHEHGYMVSPCGIDCRQTTAQRSLVNDVVMNKRCVMEHFKGGAGLQHIFVYIAKQLGAKYNQYRTYLFAFLFKIRSDNAVHQLIGCV